jgi:hypothetical protein
MMISQKICHAQLAAGQVWYMDYGFIGRGHTDKTGAQSSIMLCSAVSPDPLASPLPLLL